MTIDRADCHHFPELPQRIRHRHVSLWSAGRMEIGSLPRRVPVSRSLGTADMGARP